MKGGCILESIRIKNVRSLKDTGRVSLPRITLLVGENSSGKSTFLRTFPLIKQSICKRTDGPLLWAGDVDDYVDFGSFSETVTNDNSDTIEFEFAFPFEYDDRYSAYYPTNLYEVPGHSTKSNYISYSIVISKRKSREFISRLDVHLNNTAIIFKTESPSSVASIEVDGINIVADTQNPKEPDRYYYNYSAHRNVFGFTFPSINDIRSNLRNQLIAPTDDEQPEYVSSLSRMEEWATIQFIGSCLCHGMTIEEIESLVISSAQTSKRKPRSSYRLRLDIVRKVLTASEAEQRIYFANLKLLFVYSCLPQIDMYLETYFRQVHYIAPLRATAERYYRLRNLAIDEVDYQGKNLAIFLHGLSEQKRTNFQKWTQEQFGFKVFTEIDGGHVSVKIALCENNKAINLSDTGFGYSQILPIITQLWDLSTRKHSKQKESVPLVIAIEQPELHLHPAIQAKLADAFIACIHLAEKNGYQLQLLLETHSQTIVNQFGRSIIAEQLKTDDISVLLFDKGFGEIQTTVRVSNYSSDGFLENWPIGFFAP